MLDGAGIFDRKFFGCCALRANVTRAIPTDEGISTDDLPAQIYKHSNTTKPKPDKRKQERQYEISYCRYMSIRPSVLVKGATCVVCKYVNNGCEFSWGI